MEYNGKKIGFKRTVGAIADLTKLAPGGRVDRLGEIFSEDNLGLTLESGVHFLAILNKWYEKSLAFENKEYIPDPVPEDWFMMLDMEDFTELMNEAMKQFQEDDEASIETTELKGKKNG